MFLSSSESRGKHEAGHTEEGALVKKGKVRNVKDSAKELSIRNTCRGWKWDTRLNVGVE